MKPPHNNSQNTRQPRASATKHQNYDENYLANVAFKSCPSSEMEKPHREGTTSESDPTFTPLRLEDVMAELRELKKGIQSHMKEMFDSFKTNC